MLLFLCMSIALSACVFPTPNVREPADWKQAISSGRQSVVFGRIQWMEHGQEKTINGITSPVVPNLLRMEDKSNRYGQVDDHGEFVWALEPGTYFIDKITYVRPLAGTHFIYPRAAFRVPDSGRTYYIGTLKVDFARFADRVGLVPDQVSVDVADQGEPAYAHALEKLKLHSADVEKSLLVQDRRLPDSVDANAESFMRAMTVLNLLFSGVAR